MDLLYFVDVSARLPRSEILVNSDDASCTKSDPLMSETNPRRLLWLLAPVALALVALFGVLKMIRDRDRASASFAVDHVVQGPKIPPKTIAQGDFAVARPQRISFIVPPHVLTPRLRGEFSTFVRGRDGARLPDSSAGIDFMLLNESQYQDFIRGSRTA
jgi:hypothetical protein